MNDVRLNGENWKTSNMQVFWGEIAPFDHLVQFYDNENGFMATLEGFVGSGFLSGESVIIFATQTHLHELNERLQKQGFDLDTLMRAGQYFPIDGKEALSQFCINNRPDEILFNYYISRIITKAGNNNRKIRAFGEMVALLSQQGHNDATVELENLWHRLHAKNNFLLYCAYPKSVFTSAAKDTLNKICCAHSKIIDGQAHPSTEIFYRPVENENAIL